MSARKKLANLSFAEWLQREGRGAMVRVHHKSLVSMPTLRRIKNGYLVSVEIAELVSAATAGEVTVGSLRRPMSSRDSRLLS